MENSRIKKGTPIQERKTRFTLSTAQMEDYCRRIIYYLEKDKPYRMPGYSLWELSRETGISTKIISKSINGYLGHNFPDIINRMRIHEAKNILCKMAVTENRTMIEEVGLKCGFRSRSVFFASFSKYEGISPKKYMDSFKKVGPKR